MNSSDIIPYLFFGTVIAVSIGITILQQNKRDKMLANLAKKRGGGIKKGGLFRYSKLRLPYKGNTLIIDSLPGTTHGSSRTIATLRTETAMLPTLDILRNNLTQKIIGSFGKERILMNDEEFDRKCIVRSEDPLLPQRILTSDMQQRFLGKTLPSLELRVSQQNVQVKMLSIPGDEETFDYFIDTVFAILQKIL